MLTSGRLHSFSCRSRVDLFKIAHILSAEAHGVGNDRTQEMSCFGQLFSSAEPYNFIERLSDHACAMGTKRTSASSLSSGGNWAERC